MFDELFIENQIRFMYGKYYNNLISNDFNNIISIEKSNYDISVVDCFNNEDALLNYDKNIMERLKDFIQILKQYWNKEHEGYVITTNWHDNVHFDKFIITYNRIYNSTNSIIFPLVGYHLPSVLKIEDNISYKHKNNKLFWRGTTTGDDNILHNIRYNIISRNFNIHPDIDIGFSNFCQCVYDNNKQAFDILKKDNLDKKNQLHFKFILNIEGNDAASSFPWALASNCCPLHNYPFRSETYLFGQGLEPYIHFVPIKNDGSDLLEIYYWCLNNQEKCETISLNGKKYMEKYRDVDLFDKIMTKFFDLYPKTIYN
jgi:hypothetical protein